MPITPLHFGVLAPINHFAKGKVSNTSFVIGNIWLDGPIIMSMLFNLDYMASHSNHTYVNALIIAIIIGVFRWRDKSWWLGATIGTLSHVFIDSFVHLDMVPFFFVQGNPFYMGWLESMSYTLMPLTFWWALQCTSFVRTALIKHRMPAGQGT